MERRTPQIALRRGIAWLCLMAVLALNSAWIIGAHAADTSPSSPTRIYLPVISAPHIVNTDQTYVVTRNYQAFDTCYTPRLQELATWWVKSPYWAFNLYLGGSSLYSGCNNTSLDSSWLSKVDQQGWNYILTWAGRQAQCAKYYYAISYDLNTAYLQGRTEADLAVNRSRELGFAHGLAIYLDIEGYAKYSTPECRASVNSYVSGWTSRLHELGHISGVYGSCDSKVADWAGLPNIPDDLWIAYWSYASYYAYPSVYSVGCVPDKLWANHQRIRQYAGEFYDSWGGVTIYIDSDIVDGMVQAYGPGGLKPPEAYRSTTMLSAGTQLLDIQLVDGIQGWALVDNRLLWTGDGGAGWQDITPAEAASAQLMDAFFFDTLQGWLLAQSNGELIVLRTSDGGASWKALALPPAAPNGTPEVATASLGFTDALSGWVSARFQSSPVFSHGALYRTSDGGLTWTALPLPVAGEVRFVDRLRGWLAGGPADDRLFATSDGGQAWQTVALPIMDDGAPVRVGLPSFSSPTDGLLQVTRLRDTGDAYETYVTDDGGATWQLSAEQQPGPMLLASSGGAGLPGKATLPEGATQAQFSDALNGWAQAWEGSCSGVKGAGAFTCTQGTHLYQTADGGQTWIEITPKS